MKSKFIYVILISILFVSCDNKKSFFGASDFGNNEEEVEEEEWEDCVNCNGRGYFTHTCSTCEGKGRIYTSITSSEPNVCETCMGTGKAPCYNCRNMGYFTCKDCSGSGSIVCTVCHGAGVIRANYGGEILSSKCGPCQGSGYLKCYSCRGEGHVACNECYGNGHIECPTCHGREQSPRNVVLKADAGVCPTCDGKGKTKEMCEECEGEGRIKVEP